MLAGIQPQCSSTQSYRASWNLQLLVRKGWFEDLKNKEKSESWHCFVFNWETKNLISVLPSTCFQYLCYLPPRCLLALLLEPSCRVPASPWYLAPHSSLKYNHLQGESSKVMTPNVETLLLYQHLLYPCYVFKVQMLLSHSYFTLTNNTKVNSHLLLASRANHLPLGQLVVRIMLTVSPLFTGRSFLRTLLATITLAWYIGSSSPVTYEVT